MVFKYDRIESMRLQPDVITPANLLHAAPALLEGRDCSSIKQCLTATKSTNFSILLYFYTVLRVTSLAFIKFLLNILD